MVSLLLVLASWKHCSEGRAKRTWRDALEMQHVCLLLTYTLSPWVELGSLHLRIEILMLECRRKERRWIQGVGHLEWLGYLQSTGKGSDGI